MNLLQDVVFLYDRVIKFDFGALAHEFLMNLGIGNRRAAGDQVAQFVKQDFIFYAVLKLRNG